MRAKLWLQSLWETPTLTRGRLAAFGGNLPPKGIHADSEPELIQRMQQGGYLPGQADQARAQLYRQHSILHAKGPRDVSVYGKPRLNLDRRTGDAALSQLGVDPETRHVQAVPRAGANRTSAPLKRVVYADKGAADAQEAAEETGAKLPVYVGLSGGRTARGNRGVVVGAVVPGSPLAAAGVRPGDVITELGGARARTQEVLRALASGMSAGKPYTLRVIRGGRAYRTTLVPTSR